MNLHMEAMTLNKEGVDALIRVFLNNFSLAMLIIAIIFILFHKLIRRRLAESEIVYRWVAFFAVGLACLFAFVFHAFYPRIAAKNIGWFMSQPFQYEIAIANLAISIIAILSFNASYGFRLATVIATTIFLWGDAIGHLYQITMFHDLSPGNAGSWLVTDIIVPIILILTLGRMKSSNGDEVI